MTGSPPPPAHPPGILSLTPRVLQCEECGVTADADEHLSGLGRWAGK